ncbi:hypothetical protein GGS20DRAFT_531640 [Poronia punctata]|nr:hypothetical protein GGS20DRAFT_531640 [Poronia punctata]
MADIKSADMKEQSNTTTESGRTSSWWEEKPNRKDAEGIVTYSIDTMLNFIETGEYEAFQRARKPNNNTDRLTLATSIVAKYSPPEKSVGDDSDDSSTDVAWLQQLIDGQPGDNTTRQSMAGELIRRIGSFEARGPGSSVEVAWCHRILEYIIDSTVGLHRNAQGDRQTVFHVAAINGSVRAMNICMAAIDDETCCEGGQDHTPGCPAVRGVLEAKDNKGRSPLDWAIDKGRIHVVREILSIFGAIELEQLRGLVKRALTSNGNSIEMMHELLTERSVEPKTPIEVVTAGETKATTKAKETYRTDVIDQNILKLAIGHYNSGVFEFLADVGGHVLGNPECSLLHYAVYINSDEAARYLLNNFPSLATKFQPHPDCDSESSVSHETSGYLPDKGLEVDDDGVRVPVLALYKGEDKDLRDLILRVVMEQMPISEVRKHLVGPAWHGREITLDLTGLAINPTYLQAFVDSVCNELKDGSLRATAGIRFEHILKYVSIPLFGSEIPKRRAEAMYIFRWLKDCMNVKRVIEVTVDDCRHCPTTEEDMETALEGLGVRYLDWRRPDLSITSIKKVASEVGTLHLYSSGSLAVVNHWLGPDGINTLKLESLYIHIIQDEFVSPARAAVCEELCKEARLNVTPVVTVEKVWHSEPSRYKGHVATRTRKKQRPIELTGLTHFVDHYTAAWEHLKPEEPNNRPTRTKVAVLDSGITRSRFPLRGDRHRGRSFVLKNDGKSETVWWLATDPHGSQMANIISQLDPNCELSFYQVAEDMNYITPDTVIKALREAINNDVDIINCSFVLDDESSELRDLLTIALQKGIVIICSTADQGEYKVDVWPAAYYRARHDEEVNFENIFPIVGCDEYGKLSRWASERAGRFMLPGENIDASSSDSVSSSSSSTNHQSAEIANIQGSDVATAIGTGLASLVLACYRMVENQVGQLADRPGLINAVFAVMTEAPNVNNGQRGKPRKLVQPSRFLPSREEDIGDPDEFLEVMTQYMMEVTGA